MLTWLAIILVALLAFAAFAYRPFARFYREVEFERARELFSLQRERMEAKFLDLAGSSGKPKGLRWENCDFHSSVSFVRDKSTSQLSAFVEVTIQFSAIEGGGMEEVAAVHDLRSATAVFHYHRGHWGTGGRALFNMNPREAIDHFHAQFESIPTAP